MLSKKIVGSSGFMLLSDKELLDVTGGDMCYCLSGRRWKFECFVETASESECITCCNNGVMRAHFIRNTYHNLARTPGLGGFVFYSDDLE